MKFLIVFACILAIAAAGKEKKAKGEENKNPICSKELPVNATTCCPGIPSFQQFFDQCKAQCADQTTTAEPTTPPKRGKGGKQEKGKKEEDNGKGQMFKCVMPCVLQAANVLGPDGNISSDALVAALVASASPDWAQIVPDVTAACFANATAAPADKPKKAKGEKPKEGCYNGKILKCVFKNLYLSCPSTVLVDSPDCADLTSKISQCPCEHGEGMKRGEGERGQGEGNGEGKKGKKNEKQERNQKGKGRGKAESTTEAPTEA